MRFLELIVVAFLSVFLGTAVLSAFTGSFEMAEKKRQCQRKAESLEFISESFRSSCNGIGFSTLDEWKSTNRTLWKLEEIGWRKEGNVFYGFWKGPDGDGEVIQRLAKNENYSESPGL